MGSASKYLFMRADKCIYMTVLNLASIGYPPFGFSTVVTCQMASSSSKQLLCESVHKRMIQQRRPRHMPSRSEERTSCFTIESIKIGNCLASVCRMMDEFEENLASMTVFRCFLLALEAKTPCLTTDQCSLL